MRAASPRQVSGAGGPVLAAAAADDSLLLRGGEASARRTSLRSSGGAGAEADGAEIKYHLVEKDSLRAIFNYQNGYRHFLGTFIPLGRPPPMLVLAIVANILSWPPPFSMGSLIALPFVCEFLGSVV